MWYLKRLVECLLAKEIFQPFDECEGFDQCLSVVLAMPKAELVGYGLLTFVVVSAATEIGHRVIVSLVRLRKHGRKHS